MAHALYHARSAARAFGGKPADYLLIERWFDQTKAHVPTARHRVYLHNTFGIELCEGIFGAHWQRASDGVYVPVHHIARRHIEEDLRFLPTLRQCLRRHPYALHGEPQEPPAPLTGAEALAARLGGIASDYATIVAWFARPMEILRDRRFFVFLGNSFGIFLAEERFGVTMARASDRSVLPVRSVAETHVLQMLGGHIPTLTSVLNRLPLEPWMARGAARLSEEFPTDTDTDTDADEDSAAAAATQAVHFR